MINTLPIGDIEKGRENLGSEMPVAVYRLFEYSMRETLENRYGKEEMIRLFREAGYKSGKKFYDDYLEKNSDINVFFQHVAEIFLQFKIGILRVEQISEGGNKIMLSIGEDLDCSGLPVVNETVCNYDEGFIKGILDCYTGQQYEVIEIDCWAKGGRTCRFEANLNG